MVVNGVMGGHVEMEVTNASLFVVLTGEALSTLDILIFDDDKIGRRSGKIKTHLSKTIHC